MSRFLFLATIATVIAAAAAAIDTRSVRPGPPVKRVLRPSVISALGIVEGATDEVELRPEVDGVVVKLRATLGDWVEKGDPLVQLDDRHAQARVAEGRAGLAAAQSKLEELTAGAHKLERLRAEALRRAAASRLDQARTSFERLVSLRAKKAISAQESDDAESQVSTLRAELAAAEAHARWINAPPREHEVMLAKAGISRASAELLTAQVALDKTLLTAPSAGHVLDINAEIGELVSPKNQQPVVVLSDTRRLFVRAYIEELDAPRVKVGATAEVTTDGIQGVFPGVVRSLSPRMAAKEAFAELPNELYDTKVREALIELREQEGMIIGLRVEVRLTSQDNGGSQ